MVYSLYTAADSICDDPDEVDAYDESSIHSLSSHSLFENDKSTCHSTPRPSSKFMSSRRSMKPISQISPTKVNNYVYILLFVNLNIVYLFKKF